MLVRIGAFVTQYTSAEVWDGTLPPAVAPSFDSSTVYLYPTIAAADRGVMAGGSGFVVGIPFDGREDVWHLYVVTNRHVVEDAKSRVIRVNTTAHRSVAIPSDLGEWTCAANDDIAVLPFTPPADWLPGLISVDMFLDETCEIGGWPLFPGDEAIFFGRFVNHEGHQRNKPVVRFGNISMLPDASALVRVGDINQLAFLVECRSLGGFSGSPAFVQLSDRRWMGTDPRWAGAAKQRGPIPTRVPKFLGVDCAHLPFWSPVCKEKEPKTKIPEMWSETNSGMAVVIPAWRLLSLINQEKLVEERKRDESAAAKRGTASAAAVPDALAPDDVPFTKDDFEQALKKVARKLPDSGTTQTSDE